MLFKMLIVKKTRSVYFPLILNLAKIRNTYFSYLFSEY